jgi:hypothetical protein
MFEQATTGVVAVVRPWEVQVSAPLAMRPSAAGHRITRTVAPTYVKKNGTDLPALGPTLVSPPV